MGWSEKSQLFHVFLDISGIMCAIPFANPDYRRVHRQNAPYFLDRRMSTFAASGINRGKTCRF